MKSSLLVIVALFATASAIKLHDDELPSVEDAKVQAAQMQA